MNLKETLGLGSLAVFALVASTSAFTGTSVSDDTLLDQNEEIAIHMDGINLDEVEIVSSSEYKDSSLGVSPRISYIVVNEELTSSTGSQLASWRTRTDMRYYRVFIDNYSSVDYTVTGYTGTFTVPKNDYIILYTKKPVSVGEKKVTVSSSNGSKLNGLISVRLAETLAEVKPK